MHHPFYPIAASPATVGTVAHFPSTSVYSVDQWRVRTRAGGQVAPSVGAARYGRPAVSRPVHTHARRLAAATLLLATPLAAAASSASAATLGLDQRCYVAGEQASFSGSGFTARSAVTVNRVAEPVASATADNSGAIRGKLLVPEVGFGLVESQVEVVASDGTNSARAFLNIAKVGAAFTPTTGDPKTLRVSHVVSGFGLAEEKPSIYLHYVSPDAQKVVTKPTTTKVPKTGGGTTTTQTDAPGVKSIRLGQLRGPCGVLRTSPRRLFPFKVTPGKWRLQYDTRPLYTKGTASSSFLWVSQSVTIDG